MASAASGRSPRLLGRSQKVFCGDGTAFTFSQLRPYRILALAERWQKKFSEKIMVDTSGGLNKIARGDSHSSVRVICRAGQWRIPPCLTRTRIFRAGSRTTPAEELYSSESYLANRGGDRLGSCAGGTEIKNRRTALQSMVSEHGHAQRGGRPCANRRSQPVHP